MHDRRADGRAGAERHDRSVPEAEGEAAGDTVEDALEDFRGAPRAGVLGKDHVCAVKGIVRTALPATGAQQKNTSKALRQPSTANASRLLPSNRAGHARRRAESPP